MKATDYLLTRDDVDPEQLSIVGIGRAGTAVLHAGALDERFREVVIRQWTDTSWITVVEAPTVLNNMTHVVPRALMYYDLPDLVKAISPRSVVYSEEPNLSAVKPLNAGVPGPGMLEQNYPNPFSRGTTLSYTLGAPGHVSLKLFNVEGREVMVLVDGYQAASRYRLNLDASLLEGGIYFCRMTLNGSEAGSMKMVVSK
jgi:hypothetical protein